MTVRLLPEVGLNPEENLVTAIAFYTKYSPFSKKHSWNWSDISWDVKGICKASEGELRKMFNLVYE